MDAACEVLEVRSACAVHRGAERVGRAVCEGDGVGDGGRAHEQEDRGEELGLRDGHGGRDVCDEGGREVVASGVVGVDVAFSAGEEARALLDGVLDEVFEVGEIGVGDGGADVDGGFGICVED